MILELFFHLQKPEQHLNKHRNTLLLVELGNNSGVGPNERFYLFVAVSSMFRYFNVRVFNLFKLFS